MLGGPNDHCNAYRDDPRRGRRHRGLRLGRDAAADVPDVGRAQGVHHARSPTARKAARRASRRRPCTSRATTPTATSTARPASIAWCASARSTPPARRQTSFASVDVLPEIDDTIDIVLQRRRPEARRLPLRRARRPAPEQDRVGRALHAPADRHRRRVPQRALAAQERRQRDGACSRPSSIRLEEEKREAEFAKKYDEKGDVSFGNQIRSYVLQPYQLVKDVRTDYEVGNPRAVLDGGLDGFIESYLRLKLAGGGRQEVVTATGRRCRTWEPSAEACSSPRAGAARSGRLGRAGRLAGRRRRTRQVVKASRARSRGTKTATRHGWSARPTRQLHPDDSGLRALLTGQSAAHHFSAVVTVRRDGEPPPRSTSTSPTVAGPRVEVLASTYLVQLGSSDLIDAGPDRIVWGGDARGRAASNSAPRGRTPSRWPRPAVGPRASGAGPGRPRRLHPTSRLPLALDAGRRIHAHRRPARRGDTRSPPEPERSPGSSQVIRSEESASATSSS